MYIAHFYNAVTNELFRSSTPKDDKKSPQDHLRGWRQINQQEYDMLRLEADNARLREALETLCNGLEWNIENHPEAMNETDSEALQTARAVAAK